MYYAICLALLTPLVSFAQFNRGDDGISDFGERIVDFITNILTPLVFGVALLLFIYGVYLYFIQGAEEDDSRKTGRSYILWSIIALVIMVSVWGITNLIASGFGFNDPDAIDGLIPTAGEVR